MRFAVADSGLVVRFALADSGLEVRFAVSGLVVRLAVAVSGLVVRLAVATVRFSTCFSVLMSPAVTWSMPVLRLNTYT